MFYYHNRVHKQPQSYERHSLILFFLLNVFCSYQKFCLIFFVFFLFLFPVCQIGSVCPEPKYTEHQEIKENNAYHTEWKVMEYFRIRQIRIDIIIPLLQHDSVASDSFILQMVNVLTICMPLHCLNNFVVSRILSQQALIIAGNHYSVVCNYNRSIFLSTIPL